MMKRYLGVVTLLALAFVGLMDFKPVTAHAAAGFSIITSPLPIKLNTTPGQTVTTQLRMKNEGTTAEGIKVGLLKFGADGTTGQPQISNLTSKDSYASWVHFSPSVFIAQPGIWYSVTMTINVPADAGLGYYLAATFSEANVAGLPATTNLNGVVATLVLLNVDTGNEKRSLQLVSFTTSHHLYEYLPVTFKVGIHNNGNIYLPPVGNIFIMKGRKTVATLDFNDAGGSVLPNSTRDFSQQWSDGFPVFVEKLVNDKPTYTKNGPKLSLKWDFTQLNKFRFGEYSANLLVVYDNGKNDVPLQEAVSFWVIPWKLLLLVIAVLALVGFGVYSLVRSTLSKTRGGVSKYRHGRR